MILTFRTVLFFALLLSCAGIAAGEPVAPPKNAEAPARARDVDELIDAIPSAELDKSIIMQTGDIKVPTVAIEKVELAYVAAERRRNAKFVMSPETRAFMRKRFAFRFLANALVE